MGIKLAKILHGEKLSPVEVERLLHLRKLILELIPTGKLLCPSSDQEEEYEADRLDTEVYAEFSRLSQGVRMNPWIAVQDSQVRQAMIAHVTSSKEIVLPWRMYFHEDPFHTIKETQSRKFIVCVTSPKGSPIVAMRRHAKELDCRETEERRQKLV